MRTRAPLALIFLLLAVVCEAVAVTGPFAWVRVMARFPVHALTCGETTSPAHFVPSVTDSWWLTYLLTAAAGVIAVVAGVRVTALIGAALGAIGALMALSPTTATAASLTMTIGIAVFRPCPIVVAAEILDARRADGRAPFVETTTAALILGSCIDGSTLLGPRLHGVIRGSSGEAVLAAALFAAAISLCAAAFAISRRPPPPIEAVLRSQPYREPTPPRRTHDSAWRGATIRGVVYLLTPVMLAVGVAYMLEVPSTARRSWLASITHPALRTVFGFVLAGVAILLSRRRPSFMPMGGWGAALLLYGIALFPALGSIANDRVSDGGPFFTSAILGSVATPVLNAVSLTYVTLSVRGRWRTLAVAIWIAVC